MEHTNHLKQLRRPRSTSTPRTQAVASSTAVLPRESARRNAGYDSLKIPARKLGLSERYLRRLELHGGAPYHTAMRLSHFYGCPLMLWI